MRTVYADSTEQYLKVLEKLRDAGDEVLLRAEKTGQASIYMEIGDRAEREERRREVEAREAARRE